MVRLLAISLLGFLAACASDVPPSPAMTGIHGSAPVPTTLSPMDGSVAAGSAATL